MLILRAYIIKAVVRGVATTLAVLVGVGICIEFVGQLNDVGEGSYELGTALAYVALRIPRWVFQTLPAAALIGALLGLGNLAVQRELVVMRASGISPWQLMTAVGLAGFGLSVLMALLGESLAPSLGAYASELRSRALNEDLDLPDGQSIWLKEGSRFLNLRRQGGELGYEGGVFIFDVDAEGALERVARADAATLGADGAWALTSFRESIFASNRVESRQESERALDQGVNPDILELAVVRADLLDTEALRRYIDYLLANDLDAHSYQMAYWSRIANIASVALMTMLALPFVFGGLRSAGAGARMLVGLVIGLGYYVVAEVLASSGEVFELDPRLVAWAPSALLLLLMMVLLSRVR